MIRAGFFAALSMLAAPAAADIIPMPDLESPRIQSANWVAGETVVLTALPDTPLTVMLEPGDQILRVTLSNDRNWAVKVSDELDSLTLLPTLSAEEALLTVATANRTHEFRLQTGNGLMAAYLVRLNFGAPVAEPAPIEVSTAPGDRLGSYRMRGDRDIRPSDIFDDGRKTWIAFAPDRPLPAVFAIGASGKEEVVNGYMRGDFYVLDRVYERLVFRIDREKATARRSVQGERR